MGSLLPVKAGTKDRPLVNRGTEASSDAVQIKRWSRQFPGCNWAMATGHGVVVVDLDGADAERERGYSVQEVAARLGVSSHSLSKWGK